jgi:hypothetical protein
MAKLQGKISGMLINCGYPASFISLPSLPAGFIISFGYLQSFFASVYGKSLFG